MSDPRVPGNRRYNPISIDDDVVETDKEILDLQRKYAQDQHRRNSALDAQQFDEDEIIAFENEIIAIEDELAAEQTTSTDFFIDLTNDDEPTYHPEGLFPDPTPILRPGETEVAMYTNLSELKLRKGMTVQLSYRLEPFDAQFLKIAMIVRRRDGLTRLRGHVYTRTRNLHGKLEWKLNEVVLVTDVYGDDKSDWNRQSMVDHNPEHVDCIRLLRTTNAEHPECGIDRRVYDLKGKQWVTDHGVLVCRWQFIRVFKDISRQRANKPDEWLVRRITKDEADKAFAVDDEVNSNKWRGGKVPGGTINQHGEHEMPAIQLDISPGTAHEQRLDVQQRFYSGADFFAGAGGASRGMVDAKIKLRYAIDNWDTAVATHHKNFGVDVAREMDIYDFIHNATIYCRADIIHMSPPCQFWSPAHTIPGVNDEVNVAALYSCGHIVDKVRPRIFTVEQTFGILFDRFKAHFDVFIGCLTQYGYSVRWKIVHFANWGLCQTRRRLIIIGAAPGEHLPDFPQDTHFKKGTGSRGQLTFQTVRDVFARIPLTRGQYQHDINQVTHYNPRKPQWDPSTQLSTVTCKGGERGHHWTGKRALTIREFACLQGFPVNHSFEGSRAVCVKQIGNAVPPTMAKKLFKHLVKWLKIQDGAYKPDDMDVKVSEARQRFERIKIDQVVETDEDELSITKAKVKSGASAELAIAISDSDDDPTDTDYETDTDSESVVYTEDEDDITISGSRATPKQTRYGLRPRRDQLPTNANSRLRPFGLPYSGTELLHSQPPFSYVNQTTQDRETEDAHIMPEEQLHSQAGRQAPSSQVNQTQGPQMGDAHMITYELPLSRPANQAPSLHTSQVTQKPEMEDTNMMTDELPLPRPNLHAQSFHATQLETTQGHDMEDARMMGDQVPHPRPARQSASQPIPQANHQPPPPQFNQTQQPDIENEHMMDTDDRSDSCTVYGDDQQVQIINNRRTLTPVSLVARRERLRKVGKWIDDTPGPFSG